MFLSQPLLDVLIGRDIRDIDEFLRQPSFSDLDDPFSIPNLRAAVDLVLVAIKEQKRIAIYGDYDCDGILASHILQSGLRRFGAKVRVCLPHRDDCYGLSAPAVHQFSLRGIHLLLTVDNGINAQSAVRLALRLGIEVIVIDRHRIQQKADTLAVWSEEFSGAGLAAMFMIGMAMRAGCAGHAIEKLIHWPRTLRTSLSGLPRGSTLPAESIIRRSRSQYARPLPITTLRELRSLTSIDSTSCAVNWSGNTSRSYVMRWTRNALLR